MSAAAGWSSDPQQGRVMRCRTHEEDTHAIYSPTTALQRCVPTALVQAPHTSPILRPTGQFLHYHGSSPALGGPHNPFGSHLLAMGPGSLQVDAGNLSNCQPHWEMQTHAGWVTRVCTKPWAAVTNKVYA